MDQIYAHYCIQLTESESLRKAQNLYCRELSLHVFMTKLNFQLIAYTNQQNLQQYCVQFKGFMTVFSLKSVCCLHDKDKHKIRQAQDFIMDMTITLIITILISARIWYWFIMLVFRVLMNMFKLLSGNFVMLWNIGIRVLLKYDKKSVLTYEVVVIGMV